MVLLDGRFAAGNEQKKKGSSSCSAGKISVTQGTDEARGASLGIPSGCKKEGVYLPGLSRKETLRMQRFAGKGKGNADDEGRAWPIRGKEGVSTERESPGSSKERMLNNRGGHCLLSKTP